MREGERDRYREREREKKQKNFRQWPKGAVKICALLHLPLEQVAQHTEAGACQQLGQLESG